MTGMTIRADIAMTRFHLAMPPVANAPLTITMPIASVHIS